nr:hydroxyethylthiazole kinase [uncultured Bacillus sp.]
MEKGRVHSILKKVRHTSPKILNVTHFAAGPFTGNGLLALGAFPIIAEPVEETADIVGKFDIVVLNIDSIRSEAFESYIAIGRSANKQGTPVIINMAEAGIIVDQAEIIRQLLKEICVSIIYGNAPAAAVVAAEKSLQTNHVKEMAALFAKWFNAVAVVSGKEDYVSDGVLNYAIYNGDPIMAKVMGAGSLFSAVIGTFAAVENNYLEAAVSARIFNGVAAEIAANKTEGQGAGSFQIEYLNQLSILSSSEIDLYSSFEKL